MKERAVARLFGVSLSHAATSVRCNQPNPLKEEGRVLSSPLTDPTSACLSCSQALHRPYKFGLDGQLGPLCKLPLGAADREYAAEDMVARLGLVRLSACHVQLVVGAVFGG